jgi:DNA invertase Pin-like site-specific DNA recombinase
VKIDWSKIKQRAAQVTEAARTEQNRNRRNVRTPSEVQAVRSLRASGMGLKTIAKRTGVPLSTVARLLVAQ